MSKKQKPYTEMNAKELAEATREFDREFIAETGTPLTAADKARHARAAKRGRGRPRVGKGAEKILISMERGLLKRADAYATRFGLSRSELIARSIEEKISEAVRRKTA